jgi:lipopolysaccharide export system protein LptC
MTIAFNKRNKAFIEAARHTKRVHRLRWLLPLISLTAAIAFAGVSYLRSLLSQIDIGPLQLEGTSLVLQSPKIAGVDKNQHAYEITAKTAKQSITQLKQVELSMIEAKMQLVGDSWAHVSSDRGMLNSETEHVLLDGNVHITSSYGYDIRLQTLKIDMKAGSMVSEQPVIASQGENKISADRLSVNKGGESIRFEGNVHTEFKAANVRSAP